MDDSAVKINKMEEKCKSGLDSASLTMNFSSNNLD